MDRGEQLQESSGWDTVSHSPRVYRPVALGSENPQSPLCPTSFGSDIGSVRVVDNGVEVRYSSWALEDEAVWLMEQLADYCREVVAHVGATLSETPYPAWNDPARSVFAFDVSTLIASMDAQSYMRRRVEQLYSWGQDAPDEPDMEPESLRHMMAFCSHRPFLPRPEIFVSPNGYMVLTWENPNYLVNLDFLPDGQVEWTKLNRTVEGNPLESGLLSIPDMVTQVLEWV